VFKRTTPFNETDGMRPSVRGAAMAAVVVLAVVALAPPAAAVRSPRTPPECDTPSSDPACAQSAQVDPTVLPGGSGPAAIAGYPTKPEAPAPPRGGGFDVNAVNAARVQLGGKGVYLCNEVSGIDGPSCAGGVPRSDEELISLVRDALGSRVLWVRCGDSRRGFPSGHKAALQRLRPKAAAAGMAIVCWDVPNFWNIQEDARRLAEMAGYADSVATDLESGSDTIGCAYASTGCGYAGPELETDKGQRWATAYSGWVRYYLGVYYPSMGDGYPLIAVTMQPQTHPAYPFDQLASSFNVFSPMLYRGVTWFNNNDPGQGENARAGNPFIPTAYAVLRSRGVDSNHDIITTGMTYSATGLTAHPAQIINDMQLSLENGGLGFAAFVFQDLFNHPDWGSVFRSFSWLPSDARVPYTPLFGGAVHVAVGDVESGGDAEVITGPGPGGGPHVRVLRRDGSEVVGFFAYTPGFGGGVNVAACDFDGVGGADIVTGAGPGGGPHVRVLRANLTEITGFFAYTPLFTGGVNVACGDVDGDGHPEVVTGAGAGGGPHVRVIRSDLTEMFGFFAYTPVFTGGVNVACGDVDGDGRDEIITGAGPGGGPHVRVIRADGTELTGFFAYTPFFSGGVTVAAADVDGDGRDEIITGAGRGGGPHVRVIKYSGGALSELAAFYAADPSMSRGLYVSGGQLVAGGGAELAVGFGEGRPPAYVMRTHTGAALP